MCHKELKFFSPATKRVEEGCIHVWYSESEMIQVCAVNLVAYFFFFLQKVVILSLITSVVSASSVNIWREVFRK